MSGGGARVSIPAGVRRTIQNIKEIAGNHSDEEVYATLKECSMDPNETAQKLLLQDTFHEVKRKRDKRKESVREPAELRWRTGVQRRGGRGGHGNYSHSMPNDATAGRNATLGKESGLNQGTNKANTSFSTTPDTGNKSAISLSGSVSVVANGLSNAEHPVSSQLSHLSGVNGILLEEAYDAINTKTANSRLPPKGVKGGSASGQLARDIDQFSSNRPVVVPSIDTYSSSQSGTIKQRKSHGSGTNVSTEKFQVTSSSFPGANGSRQSSTYSSRFQHLSGFQKASHPNKEWKPKSVLVNPAKASETNDTPEVTVVTEAVSQSLPASHSVASEEDAVNLEEKVEKLKLSDRKHVIIPDHLHVPEAQRHGLSFGSFDANFQLNVLVSKDPSRDDVEELHYEPSHETDETVEHHSLSNNETFSDTKDDDFPEHPQSSEHDHDSYLMKEIVVSSSTSIAAEYNQPNQEVSLAPEVPQNFVVEFAPSYPPEGLVLQLGSQLAPVETSEPQALDTSHLPSLLVQQSYDPSANYYTPFYRPTPDADGRISPFFASGVSARYNGNVAVLPAHTGQASQENTNSAVLSTVGSTLGTQAAGTLQGSLAPQQPVPLFRQPAGFHISHYPPNYIPYSQIYPPFYASPQVHHFLSGTAFPHQPPTGSMYSNPGAATPAAAVKYSLPQYKLGSNAVNPTIVGLPAVYGAYNSTQAGYNSGPVVSTGNSTANEDLASSQFKDNGVYNSGQQSEGSSVWIPTVGREITSLQASSFYNIPQGQPMNFPPTQAGPGAFSGVFPPTQTVASSIHPLLQQSHTVAGAAAEILNSPAGVYQQPQRAQINWTNNY
ncbi:GBF-interacting protein 1-like isoform X1 [Curcuma longa]|uniref:GBF-interacting protein 1-like isoform X1 n=2 Tax=Curcuma longa TaxID=136217 RepID=UPI003D9ED5AF